jgi:probable F420-dependent oxidoreductase
MTTAAGQDTRLRFGVFLPTFCDAAGRSGAEVASFAQHAERLGFDSLWATDHLLHDSVFYRASWLDPLLSLAFAASVTTRVRLGTSVLVMPARHPLLLAKDISTLQALSGERLILGVGTGWDRREFEALGQHKAERGARTQEAIEVVRRLLDGRPVTFEGRFTRLDHIQVGPPPKRRLELWVGGGRQIAHPKSPERPVFAPAVLARIARAAGWISRPTSTPAQISEDRQAIAAHRASIATPGGDSFVVAHENFLHLVAGDDPAAVRREQQRAFERVMGRGRPFEYLDRVYLTGTEAEVVRKLQERIAAGVRYFMLHTLVPSVDQLELWMERIIPRLQGQGGTRQPQAAPQPKPARQTTGGLR